MKAVSKILFSGAAMAALVSAAPAAAQYYPQPGYGYGYPGNNYGYNQGGVLGGILDSILGGQRYQTNDRYAIDMCVRAAEARLNGYSGSYGFNGYGQYGGYGNNGYSQGYNGARVTRITNLERQRNGLKIYGLATSGYGRSGYGAYGGQYGAYNQPYGGGYNNAYRANLRFNCKVDFRGRVYDVDIDRRRSRY